MSRDNARPNKRTPRGGSSDFNKRPSFSSSGKGKTGFKKRDGDADSKPRKKYSSDEKPSKSFGDKPFVKRADGKYESASPRKSFTKKEGDFSSFDKKPFGKKSFSESGDSFERKPRKSFDDGEKRSYNKTSSSLGDKRFSKSGDGEKRSYKSYNGDKKSGFVKKSDGKYESSAPRKSYTKREDGSSTYEKKSFTKKEYGDKRPRKTFDDGEKKPYTPKLSKLERTVEKSKKAGPKKTSNQQNVSEDAVRLNRYIANAGICSRREADVLIATGVVTVNGKIITEMGYKVNPTDTVTYGGVPIKNETKKYLVLNKPKDYITTMDDPEERKTVMELIRNACKERLYPVGRLDRNTTGVLLFTNDGDLTAKLTHPKFLVRKVYHVVLDKRITSEDFRTLSQGVDLADGFIKPDAMEYVGDSKNEIGVEIHSGKNRIVRRLFEHLGYEVIKLDRIAFAGLTKKDLPRGKYRFLSEKELSFLKMLG